ncbi:MAG: hypothetical protein ACFFAU_01175 [Candidatus Hodarchaeota archaeon]
MNRNILRIVLTTLVIVLFLAVFGRRSEGAELNLKGDYYEENGCIYLTGNISEEEKVLDMDRYRDRMEAQGKIYDRERKRNLYLRDVEAQRKHDVEIETIRMEAMKAYLEAENSGGDTINVYSTSHNRTVLRNTLSQKNTMTQRNTQTNKVTQTNKPSITQKN